MSSKSEFEEFDEAMNSTLRADPKAVKEAMEHRTEDMHTKLGPRVWQGTGVKYRQGGFPLSGSSGNWNPPSMSPAQNHNPRVFSLFGSRTSPSPAEAPPWLPVAQS